MQIYNPESLLIEIPQYQRTLVAQRTTDNSEVKITRQMFAHIRVTDETEDATSFSTSSQLVTFRVILEPLVAGVLPASAQPTVMALVLVTSLAALAVPSISRYLEQLVQNVVKEGVKIKVT
jgi:hypothetical protein